MRNPQKSTLNCQLPCLPRVADGITDGPGESSATRRCKLMIRRHLDPGTERTLKKYTNDCINRIHQLTGRKIRPRVTPLRAAPLQSGDWVRVRSRAEIEDTLNQWRQVRGCAFMPEMAEYCGSLQKVFKPMKRFVDERDLKTKKSAGIILLERVICRGTAEFGSCDRSCLHFWREEWLEKVDEVPVSRPSIASNDRKQGEYAKVRPLQQIEATLDRQGSLQGCTFLPEMAQYCGTVQPVLKTMTRFVDEHDLRTKTAEGILILEGVLCKGSLQGDSCDRSCHLLWRQEWLERIAQDGVGPT